MRIKRILSVLLVIVMLAVLVPMDRVSAVVGPFSGTANAYIWSRDYSQVTAVEVHYRGNTEDQPSSGAYRESVAFKETADTVASVDTDGNVTYTASFIDSRFVTQSRTIHNPNDVVKKWDFETDPYADGWTLSDVHPGNGGYYADRIGTSGSGYLVANNSDNINPWILSPAVQLPEDACLTFWIAGGADPSMNVNYEVYCGESMDNMTKLASSSVWFQQDGTHYYSYYCYAYQGLDPKQVTVDLSDYAGKRVWLKINLNVPKHTYYDPPYSMRYPYVVLIDDVEIHGAVSDGWQQVDGKWYFYENGAAVTGWKQVSGKWYYFDDAGVMQTGWKQVGGKWYYFESSGAMATGWRQVSGKWYYFEGSGAMVTGWKQVGGKWYYFESSGAMVTGWKQVSGKWYYFESSGAMVTGWKQVSGKWYYFESGGAMVTGWKQVGGKWYYFESGGAMKTGWLKSGSSWYYLQSSGAMAANTSLTISGKLYHFNASGVCTNP